MESQKELGPVGQKVAKFKPRYDFGAHDLVELAGLQTQLIPHQAEKPLPVLPKNPLRRSLRWATTELTLKSTAFGAVTGPGLIGLSYSMYKGFNLPIELLPRDEILMTAWAITGVIGIIAGFSLGFGASQDRDGFATGRYRLED